MRAFLHRLSGRVHHRPWVRNTLGFSLVIAGVAGPLLPLLGIWMLPLGLFLLSTDFPWARRLHRRLEDRLRRWTHRQPAPEQTETTPLRTRRPQGDDH